MRRNRWVEELVERALRPPEDGFRRHGDFLRLQNVQVYTWDKKKLVLFPFLCLFVIIRNIIDDCFLRLSATYRPLAILHS